MEDQGNGQDQTEETLPAQAGARDLIEALPVTQQDLDDKRNQIVLPILQAFENEIGNRVKNQKLAKELKKWPLDKLLGQLKLVIQSVKQSGPLINMNVPQAPPTRPDPERLKAVSSMNKTPLERARLINRVERQRLGENDESDA